MNANDLLKRDHKMVVDLYTRYSKSEGEKKSELAKEILTELTLHALLEEEIYYPELENAGEKELVDEFKIEHDEVKVMIGKLTLLDIDNAEYDNIMSNMMDSVMAHVREEEEEAMPEIEELLGKDRLIEMGIQIESRKEELRESTIKRLWSEISH